MVLTIHLLMFVIALILFIVAAVGVPTGRVSTVAAGLAFLTLGLIFP